MNHRIILCFTLALAFVAGASAQQTNSFYASLAIDDSPYAVLGQGPTSAEFFTDSAVSINVLGLPLQPYLLLAGDYHAGWITGGPDLSLDIFAVGADNVIVSGFSGDTTFFTSAVAQSNLSLVFPGADFTDGGSGAVQAVVANPTAPLGLSASAACITTLRSGFVDFQLLDGESGGYTLVDKLRFPFYGGVYTQFWVGDDGYVSFGLPDAMAMPSLGELQSGPPRIAGFFDDLDPIFNGATVTATHFTVGENWRVRISWDSIFEAGVGPGVHGCDIVLFEDGSIQITWPSYVTAPGQDVLVGLSPGSNLDTASASSDLSSLIGTFTPAGTGAAIFEHFDHGANPVTNPFDLAGQTVTFYPTFGPQGLVTGYTVN